MAYLDPHFVLLQAPGAPEVPGIGAHIASLPANVTPPVAHPSIVGMYSLANGDDSHAFAVAMRTHYASVVVGRGRGRGGGLGAAHHILRLATTGRGAILY